MQVETHSIRGVSHAALSVIFSVLLCVCAIVTVVPAAAFAQGDDGAVPFGGRMPDQPDVRKVGKATWRFLPGRGEYEVRHPGQPPGFAHVDYLPQSTGISASAEEAADGSGGLISLPSNELAPICRTTGPRIVVVYSHRSSDGTPTPTSTLRSIVKRMNWKISDQSSQSSAGKRVVKMAVDCNGSGEINVYNVTSANNNFPSLRATVASALFGEPTGESAVKYLIFDHAPYEEAPTLVAGMGGPIRNDPLKSHFNDNAEFTSSAGIFNTSYESGTKQVWESHTTIHELIHSLGGSQGKLEPAYENAPESTPGHHCSDGLDILCYKEPEWFYFSDICSEYEGYKTPTTVPIDCNKDTYFNAAPAAGSWLAEYWDLAGPEDWFLVAPPKAITGAATSVKGKSALVKGEINPEGTKASYRLQYAPTSAGYWESTTPLQDIGYGNGSSEGTYKAEIPLTGLALGTTYKYRVVAQSVDYQQVYGEEKTFTTLSPPKPTITAEAATSVGGSGATLNATINPNGTETTYQFQYGKTTSYSNFVPAAPGPNIGAGSTGVKVSQSITFAVEPNTTYHYRAIATNEGGFSEGQDKTFTTPRTVNAPTYSSSFGSKGTGNGQFSYVWGMAVDPSGNVWVSDTTANRIQKFNSNGEYQCQIGSTGSGNGQFNNPRDLEADAAGNIWVADRENNRIQKISPTCQYLSQFGSKGSGNGLLSAPREIAIDPAGNIWVSDSGNDRIQKFNSKGEYLSKCGSAGSGNGQFNPEPLAIEADSDGNVWVSDEHRLQQFNSSCEFVGQFQAASFSPYSFAIDAAGTIWESDSEMDEVAGFYPEGEYATHFGEWGSGNGQFNNPRGSAIAADGTIWVADQGVNKMRVQKWLPGAVPPVLTGATKSIKRTEATLKATINPQGTATSYQFEYGTTPTYGSTVPATAKSIGSGSSGVAVSEALSGLKAGTTYYYHVVATSSKGTTYGETRHFTTWPPAGAGAQVRIGGKTFAELGITEASFSLNGTFVFELKQSSLSTAFTCSESGSGTLASTGLKKENVSLSCTEVGNPSCKTKPISFSVDGNFHSESTILFYLIAEGGCGWFEETTFLSNAAGSFEYGSEATSMNVTSTATAAFGGWKATLLGNSKWVLTGANVGKTLGFW